MHLETRQQVGKPAAVPVPVVKRVLSPKPIDGDQCKFK